MKTLLQNTEGSLQSIEIDTGKIPHMELIERELYEALCDSKGVIREMCGHILNAGGKRIRPLLVLYSGMIFSTSTKELIKAAVAAELIHMASLVHDDIIDNSFLRRSKPSINKLWGNHFAVLCGDYLFARAFGVLSNNKLMSSMGYMVEAIENMCHGEIGQAGDQFNCEVSMDIYYERIARKTAVFLECCCKSGAVVCGASQKQIRIVGTYGLNLGYAFQIIDDILDFCGNEEKTGKPRGEDLSQGNITMPVVFLLNNEKYSDWIKEIIRSKNISKDMLEQITVILQQTGIINKCFDAAKMHITRAKQCLNMLPASQNTAFLHSLADMLQARAN